MVVLWISEAAAQWGDKTERNVNSSEIAVMACLWGGSTSMVVLLFQSLSSCLGGMRACMLTGCYSMSALLSSTEIRGQWRVRGFSVGGQSA